MRRALAFAAIALVVAAGPARPVDGSLYCLPGKICRAPVPTIGCVEFVDALQLQSLMMKEDRDQVGTDTVASLINGKKCVLIPAGDYIRMLPGEKLEFTLGHGDLWYLAYEATLFKK